ncbi:hypothetical protein IMCC9480_2425 [Oxalobacteraceae bacterium IMCC9480]|nr:hypothetical protein IMCC9480_2425 [Oxalobacteraceae bacterium IMCC9480]
MVRRGMIATDFNTVRQYSPQADLMALHAMVDTGFHRDVRVGVHIHGKSLL